MKALFWSAVVNGVVAVPVMVMLVLLASRETVMGRFALSWPMKIDGLGRNGRDGRRRLRHDCHNAVKCRSAAALQASPGTPRFHKEAHWLSFIRSYPRPCGARQN